MEEPFLYAVKYILDERYTDNMDTIYRAIIRIMLKAMEDSCRDEVEKSIKNNENNVT